MESTKEQLQNEINLLKVKISELEDDKERLSLIEFNLKESEEKYKTLFENAPLPYQSLNENGSFKDINPAWLRALGYEKDEVLGGFYKDFLHPDWQEHFEKNFPAFKKRGYVKDVQFKIKHREGHYLDISFEGCVGYYPDGTFKQTYCVFQDITKRKQIELFNSNLIAAMQDGFSILDAEGAHVDVNPALIRMTGFSKEELVGTKAPHPYWPPEKYEEIEEAFKKTLSGDFSDLELTFMRKNGERFPVLVSPSWITNEKGEILNFFATVKDITERKKTENSLMVSEENLRITKARFELAVNGSNDAIWDWDDLESDEYWWSDRLYEILGYQPYEVEARISNWKKWMHPEDEEMVVNALTQHFENNVPYRIEFRMKNKKGKYIWLYVRGESIRDNSGKPVRMAGSVTDITKRKEAEKLLIHERQRLTNILEGTNAGTWDWNIQTGEVVFNERWANIMGYSLDELQPTDINTWINYVHPDDLPEANKMLEKIFNKEVDYYDVVFRQPHKNGTWVWVNARGKVVLWTKDGKPLQMSGTHIDITESKLAEAELEKHQEHLEDLVKERTTNLIAKNKELDDTMKVFVGRELTIRKLQERIRALEGK